MIVRILLKRHYYFQFANNKTEDQNAQGNCARSHHKQAKEF